MAELKREENSTFKLLYVIGTILIISGHLGNGGVNLLYDWFPPYAFHIGLFVFASGYFYKNKGSIVKFIVKKFHSLIIPLYLWNLFYGLLVLVLGYAGFTIGGSFNIKNLIFMPILDGHQFQFNMPGWFVIPLFMVQIYHAIVVDIGEKIKKNLSPYFHFVFGLIIGMAGIFLASKGFNMGIWLPIVRFMYFVPFYEAGVLYHERLEQKDTLGSFWYFLAIFVIQLIVILVYQKTPDYSQSWCSNFVDGPVLPFIVGYLGIFFWLRVCKILAPTIGRSKYILLIANNTFSIMINQFGAFFLVNTVIFALNRMCGLCPDFSIERFKTDIWYFYLLRGMEQFKIVYLAAGILFPISVQLFINKVKEIRLKKAIFLMK